MKLGSTCVWVFTGGPVDGVTVGFGRLDSDGRCRTVKNGIGSEGYYLMKRLGSESTL